MAHKAGTKARRGSSWNEAVWGRMMDAYTERDKQIKKLTTEQKRIRDRILKYNKTHRG